VFSERRTIGIIVDRDRRVIVRAPWKAGQATIAAAVESKRLWIWEKLRDGRKYSAVCGLKEFVVGETFLFLGQNYRIEIVNEPRGDVRLNGHFFELSRADRHRARELFCTWYTAKATEHLTPRIIGTAKAMGVQFTRVTVRNLKYRWGSCTPCGTLNFSWRIVQAPTLVTDDLIVHELAHVLEPARSREFWNIVAVHASSWAKCRDWLRATVHSSNGRAQTSCNCSL